jgi:hypothetical protein
MNESAWRQDRERFLVPAIWLIGVGTVFLVQQLSGWSWGQAWPLWVVLVGMASALTTILGARWSTTGWWSLGGPIAIAIVGLILLASTTGMLGLELAQLLPLWPLAVIGLGIWFLLGAVLMRPSAGADGETLSVPLAGAARATVRLRFGGGEIIVGRAEPGMLLSGRFGGGVKHRSHGPGDIEIEPVAGAFPLWWDRPLNWDMGITGEVPLDLKVETGANRSRIDLSALRISRLELSTGASETRVRLPAKGITSAIVKAGVASLTLEVPEGVAARIRSRMALGSTSIDERRFPRVADGWASPDFETATSRVEIDMEGGLGQLTVA